MKHNFYYFPNFNVVFIFVTVISVSSVFFLASMEIRYVLTGYEKMTHQHKARSTCIPVSNNGTGPDVVVYVPTPISWTKRRMVVLKQFKRELHLFNAHLIFVVGTRQGRFLEDEVQGISSAIEESKRHQDYPRIRYLFTKCRDMGDEPHNPNGTSSTTCKVYEALVHIAAFYKTSPPKYVWRGADDAYLDLAVFQQHVLPKLYPQTCRLFLGRLRFPLPTDDTDLELPANHPELYALYGLRKFGKYMVGMGYCMSWDVAHFIGASPIPPRLTWIEDVMVSQWLLFYDVDFVDVNSALSDVRMVHADEEAPATQSWLAGGESRRVLLAHRMSAAQWEALARRPAGDQSSDYLFAK
jgi:hypothetical protein